MVISQQNLKPKYFRGTDGSDEQSIKIEPPSPDQDETHCSFEYQEEKIKETDFQIAHSSHMSAGQVKHFTHDKMEEGSVYNFKLIIPHYVSREDLVPLIQVKWGSIHGKLWEIRKGKSENKFEPYCEVYNDHVVVYAKHFCDVVATCPEKVCAEKVIAFPFGQIESEPGRKETYAKVKTYICNHLYQDKLLRKV